MSYGIEVRGSDGTVNLHSDYASIVYVGKITSAVDTARVWLEGDNLKPYDPSVFEVSYRSVYRWTPPAVMDTVIPFYKPAFDNQKVAVNEAYKDTLGDWIVSLVHDGNVNQVPSVYFFASMVELAPVITDDYGLNVYNSSSELTFSSEYIPLKVDGTYIVKSPDTIAQAATGSTAPNIMATNSNLVTTHKLEADTLYSFVSLGYGVLAWDYAHRWTRKKNCYLGCEKKECASYESRWAAFVSTVQKIDTNVISLGYTGEYGGWWYDTDCGGWGGGLSASSIGAAIVAPISNFTNDFIVFTEDVASIELTHYKAPVPPTNNFETTLMMTRSSYYE